ncbi:MAG: hypothetical protein AAF333_00870 [Planctomycetota bacterium]
MFSITPVARHAASACVLLAAFGTYAHAGVPLLTWYASTTNTQSSPASVAGDGIDQALAYNSDGNVSAAQQYLDDAAAAGVQVILDVGWQNVRVGNLTPVETYIRAFADHPALGGWYLFDEPDELGLSVSEARAASDLIRSISVKPIYGAIDAKRPSTQDAYSETVDRMITFDYPFDVGDGEFGGTLEANWKSRTATSAANARSNGQQWYNVIQAYGRDGNAPDLRLPTKAELRFMTLYSLVAHDADGVMYWARYRTTRSDPLPDEPYPLGGLAWLRDVFTPMVDEFEQHYGDAVSAGALAGAVSTSDPGNIHADVYFDPDKEKYYLLVVNDEGRKINATLSLNLGLALAPQDLLSIDDGVSTFALAGGQVDLSLDAYETQSFEVRLAPEPTSVGVMLFSGVLLGFRGSRVVRAGAQI